MATAIVHEWWANFGGAENVTRAISDLMPEADVYILIKDNRQLDTGLKSRKQFESWIRRVPGAKDRRLTILMSPFAYRTLSLKKYDLVISSSHPFAHTTRFPNSKNAKYLSYVHTPSRSIWTPEIDNRSSILNLPLVRDGLKILDKNLGNHVNAIAANSFEVQNRISKYWGRDSVVIHPPFDIEVSKLPYENEVYDIPFEKKSYLVAAGRMVGYKNFHVAMDIANKINTPLVLMGSGPLESDLRQIAKRNKSEVHFEISPNKAKWNHVIENAKAFLFPTYEDFGIAPLESIALNTPVFAFNLGGAKEYIQEGINGKLVSSLDAEDFTQAINEYDFDQTALRETITQFNMSSFRTKFSNWIEKEG
jgi:glycosyltransferase involved in cell wall biosynthesis